MGDEFHPPLQTGRRNHFGARDGSGDGSCRKGRRMTDRYQKCFDIERLR